MIRQRVEFEELPPFWQQQIKKLRSEALGLRVERNKLRSQLARAAG
jgi:hypothetical protein